MYAIRSYYEMRYAIATGVLITETGGELTYNTDQSFGELNCHVRAQNLRARGNLEYRITSYNVCYTKLLRIPDRYIRPQHAHIPYAKQQRYNRHADNGATLGDRTENQNVLRGLRQTI